jgi:hypothetical protein
MREGGQTLEQSDRLRVALQGHVDAVALVEAKTLDWMGVLDEPAELRSEILIVLCAELARQERFADADSAASHLRSLGSATGQAEHLFNAACGYGMCALGLKPPEGQKLTASQQKRRQELQNQALACLKEAIDAGWENYGHMLWDADLAAVRELPEFQTLMRMR